MKKKVLIALSLIAAMCIGTQAAYAAPSPTASDTSILAEAVDVDSSKGTATALSLDVLTDANNAARKLVQDIIASAQTTAESSVDAAGNLILTDENVPLGTSVEPELVAAFDFAPSDSVKAELEKKGKVELTFEVPDVKSGDNIRVLHLANNEWEIINPTSVKDGKVSAEFTSLSPIVITKITDEVAKLDTSSKGVNFYVVVAITLIGVAAIAVVFALGSRKKPVKKQK